MRPVKTLYSANSTDLLILPSGAACLLFSQSQILLNMGAWIGLYLADENSSQACIVDDVDGGDHG